MEPLHFWNTYVQDVAPADFVWRYGKGDIQVAVEQYLQQRPSVFGIVRKGTWKDTFGAECQLNKQSVYTGLSAYLYETEEEWRSRVEEARQAEIRAKAEAKARAEAEALALAVARVEAEARARLEAERMRHEGCACAQSGDDESAIEPAVEGVPNDTTPALPVPISDAEAIALAMARVEAEARARAEAQKKECACMNNADREYDERANNASSAEDTMAQADLPSGRLSEANLPEQYDSWCESDAQPPL